MNNYFSRIVLIFLSVFMSYSLYAQSIKLHQLTTSISYNTLLERSETSVQYRDVSGQLVRIETTSVTDQQQLGFTLGYRISKPNRLFYEFGIRQLSATHNDITEDVQIPNSNNQSLPENVIKERTIYLLSRAEVGLIIFDDKKWEGSIALGVSPYFFRTRNTPRFTNFFPVRYRNIGSWIGISPRISRSINNRLELELHAHFALVDLQHNYRRVENPNLSRSQQTSTDFITKGGLINTQISLGLNVALNEPSEEEQGKKKKRKKRRRRRR